MKGYLLINRLAQIITAVSCGTETVHYGSEEVPENAEDEPAVAGFTANEDEEATQNLPPLPSIVAVNGYGLCEPIPGGAEDPFTGVTFDLATEMPAGKETAVVEHHIFGQRLLNIGCILQKTITLKRGENVFDVNFGWDHQFLP